MNASLGSGFVTINFTWSRKWTAIYQVRETVVCYDVSRPMSLVNQAFGVVRYDVTVKGESGETMFVLPRLNALSMVPHTHGVDLR
jgi:hypothetical protein